MKRIAVALAIAGCGSKPEPGVLTVNEGGDEYRITGREVAFKDLPFGDLGLPFTGAMVDVDLHIPVAKGKRDYTRATGFAELTCPAGCQIGDDKTKIVPSSSSRHRAFVGDGLDFGHLTIDRFEARIELADGHARITRWILASKDASVDLAGEVTFAKDLAQSRIEACLRFKASDALRQRDPKTYSVLALTGASIDAQGDFTLRITDRYDRPRLLPGCGPAVAAPPTRPTLSQ